MSHPDHTIALLSNFLQSQVSKDGQGMGGVMGNVIHSNRYYIFTPFEYRLGCAFPPQAAKSTNIHSVTSCFEMLSPLSHSIPCVSQKT